MSSIFKVSLLYPTLANSTDTKNDLAGLLGRLAWVKAVKSPLIMDNAQAYSKRIMLVALFLH